IHLLQLEDETNFAALFNGCVALRAELVSLGCVNGFVSEVGAGGITLRAPFSRQNISLPLNRDVKHNSTFFFSILDAVTTNQTTSGQFPITLTAAECSFTGSTIGTSLIAGSFCVALVATSGWS